MDLGIELLRLRLDVWNERIAKESFVPPYSGVITDSQTLLRGLERELGELERLSTQIQNTKGIESRNLLERVLFNDVLYLGETIERCFENDWIFIETAERQYREDSDFRLVQGFTESVLGDFNVTVIPCANYPYSAMITDFSDLSKEVSPRVILFYPYSDIRYPMMLSLLFHELGHIALRLLGEESVFNPLTSYIQELRKNVEFDVDKSKGMALESRLKSKWTAFVDYWRVWKTELFSDIFALCISGPCFFHALLHHEYGRNPYDIYWEHPPFKVRIDSLRDIAHKSGFQDPFIEREHQETTDSEKTLGLYPSTKFSENVKAEMTSNVQQLSFSAISKMYEGNLLDKVWWSDCLSQLEAYRGGDTTDIPVINLMNLAWVDYFQGTSFREANERLLGVLKNLVDNQRG